jgi:hypothetical protein
MDCKSATVFVGAVAAGCVAATAVNHLLKRKFRSVSSLEADLRHAEETAEMLQERVSALQSENDKLVSETGKPRKPVRIYIDGCFDMMHFGHWFVFFFSFFFLTANFHLILAMLFVKPAP